MVKRKKSGHGGPRRGAGRKPGRTLTFPQRMTIGGRCDARQRKRRKVPSEVRIIRFGTMYLSEGKRPKGERGESVRAEIIKEVVAWFARKYRRAIKARMVVTCWLEYNALVLEGRKSRRRQHRKAEIGNI